MARVVRALSTDKQIRISSLDATPLWNGVRRGHPHLEAPACACLTELLAAAALLQSRTLLEERLQLMLRSSGGAKTIVADCWPDGSIRGILDLSTKEATQPWIQAPGLLQVMRSNPKGQPYIGNLELVEGPIHTQIETYLQQSEQIQASLTLWCSPETGEGGGLLAEPLPNCSSERMRKLVDGLEGLEVVPFWERDPEFLIRWINLGEGAEIQSSVDLHYRCRCSKATILAALTSVPWSQIEALFPTAGPIEICCDYCGLRYLVTKDEVPEPSSKPRGPEHG